MMTVEGLYIFDEHNQPVLEHVYTGRPPPAAVLLSEYLSHSSPRPPVIYLTSVNPPTLVFSIVHDRLLFLCPSSTDAEPLVVLEFLHRVTDALDEYLGSPLLASKIDSSYDVVAQIVSEMCDAGIISTTEPNALQETVEAPNWMGNLFGGFGLPSNSPSLGPPASLQRPASPFMSGMGGGSSATPSAGSSIPWRRANVRHTSNELYVDIIETLSVVLAPSGRPLSAIANGNIVFNAKISGVPDLLLSLTAPGGKVGIQNAMDLPCFHPCVRLARWRDRPGELSFVPPDGRFVLAAYECDLLPDMFNSGPDKLSIPKLDLPAFLETRVAQGSYGDEFEVRLLVKDAQTSTTSSAATNSLSRNLGPTSRFGTSTPAFAGGAPSPTPPALEAMIVRIPISSSVRNVEDLKAGKGEAHFLASESVIEWRISSKEAASIGKAGTVLRCTLTGRLDEAEGAGLQSNNLSLKTDTSDYDDSPYQAANVNDSKPTATSPSPSPSPTASQRAHHNATLMPRFATLSFTVRGWLASGIRVDSLTINPKTSKGLGAGVTPYKGVKYHTLSRDGIEVRC